MTVTKEAVEVEEVQDGVEDASVEEANTDEPIEGGEQDLNVGGEGGEAGKDGEEDAGEAGAQEEELGKDEVITQLQQELKELKEWKTSQEKTPAEKPVPEFKEPTPEEQAAFHEKHGIPWQTHKGIAGMVATAVMQVRKEVMDAINSKFGSFERDNVIASMSKDPQFKDIHSLRPGIEKFLSKMDPSVHGKREVLEDAVIYARGLGMSGKAKQIATATKINQKIVGKMKMGGGKGSTAGKPRPKLTKVQIEAWEKFGKPHGQTLEQYAEAAASMH